MIEVQLSFLRLPKPQEIQIRSLESHAITIENGPSNGEPPFHKEHLQENSRLQLKQQQETKRRRREIQQQREQKAWIEKKERITQ